MEELKITEPFVRDKIIEFMINKPDGNWHIEKVKVADLHGHGADIVLRGGKRNSEYFIIECKGKSYSRTADSANREGWLNALGQLVTRMNVERTIQSGKTKGRPNYAYKYGLGLCELGAKTALRRIPAEIAKTLCLHIFSCDDNGKITMYTPKDFK